MRIAIPYVYTCMVYTVRVWYKYTYGIEHVYVRTHACMCMYLWVGVSGCFCVYAILRVPIICNGSFIHGINISQMTILVNIRDFILTNLLAS